MIRVRVKINSLLVPILFVVLLLVQLTAPWKGWLMLLVGLGSAWLSGSIWAHSLARNLSLRREIRYGWAQVGDRLEERFTLTNNGYLPALWVEVRDRTTMPNTFTNRATGISGQSQSQWTTHGVCNQRGLFTLGPTSIHTGDPLGFYRVSIFDPRTATVVVTPPIVPLPSIEVAMGGREGEGLSRPDAPERTVSASSVHAYTPGESLRYVHWRTSARRENLYVRQMEGTATGDWWILLDIDGKCKAGDGQNSTEEHSIILAASLADRGLRLRKAVGLVASGKDFIWYPPRRGEGQRWDLMHSLALLKPGERSLRELLRRVKPSFGRGASLVIITADTKGNWVEALIPLLWAGATPTVLLLDPNTFGGDGNVRGVMQELGRVGVTTYKIPRQMLDRPEARPGKAGHWEWRVSPGGRAVAVNKPADSNWKELV